MQRGIGKNVGLVVAGHTLRPRLAVLSCLLSKGRISKPETINCPTFFHDNSPQLLLPKRQTRQPTLSVGHSPSELAITPGSPMARPYG